MWAGSPAPARSPASHLLSPLSGPQGRTSPCGLNFSGRGSAACGAFSSFSMVKPDPGGVPPRISPSAAVQRASCQLPTPIEGGLKVPAQHLMAAGPEQGPGMAQGILEDFQGEATASRQRKERRQPGRLRFPGAFLSERHPGAPGA